jgi:hypothetical protein
MQLWREGLEIRDAERGQVYVREELPHVCAEHGFGFWRCGDAVSHSGDGAVAYIGLESYSLYDFQLLEGISIPILEARLHVGQLVIFDLGVCPDYAAVGLVVPGRPVFGPALAVWQSGACVFSGSGHRVRKWLLAEREPLSTLRAMLGAAAPAAEVDDHGNQKPQ